MGKKKKRDEFDDEDGFLRQGEAANDEPLVKLEDFVVLEKVDAFCRAYRPCDEDTPGSEAFDDARLREVFKAYVCAAGDPLAIYVERLVLEGFRMTMSVATAEPTIFAVRQDWS